MSTQAILFIHHANDMYGADIGLLHSLRSLDRSKYYPIVILPSDMPTGLLSPELDRLGVEYHIAPLGILRRKYLSLRKIIPLAVELLRGGAGICQHFCYVVRCDRRQTGRRAGPLAHTRDSLDATPSSMGVVQSTQPLR